MVIPSRKRLFADRVSANKKLFADSGVPIEKRKSLFADRVSAKKKLFADTVSANKKVSGVRIEKKTH